MSLLAVYDFVHHAISNGPILDTSRPITQWDDYALALQYQYIVDQMKRTELNLQMLEMYPECIGELFNEEVIDSDLKHYADEYRAIVNEINRRHIP